MIWPLIFAAGTAVAVLLIDVVFPRWAMPAFTALFGAVATAVCAAIAPGGGLDLLLWEFDSLARLVAVLTAGLTALAIVLYLPALRAGDAPAGETGFLLACAMTGGVVLGGVRDLITLIVALETLTLPLYALVALHRRRAGQGASAAVTFFTTSVVATAISLLGAALLNLNAGTVVLPGVMRESVIAGGRPLAVAGLALLLTGLAFKVAAVPMHAWAPSTYDGASIPVAAYLSTASKLGGVVAILLVAQAAVEGGLATTAGVTLAVLATLSLAVGTLVALRQQRTVRLLAWSSVAQAGFILAPLGGLAVSTAPALLSAALAYTMFFLALEFGAFSGIAALRSTSDGGTLDDLRGLGRSAPARSAMFAVALIGLAGLPPALAGLFAKFTVLKALLDARLWWLAAVVALMSVVGLAVYWRPLAALYRPALTPAPIDLTPTPTPLPATVPAASPPPAEPVSAPAVSGASATPDAPGAALSSAEAASTPATPGAAAPSAEPAPASGTPGDAVPTSEPSPPSATPAEPSTSPRIDFPAEAAAGGPAPPDATSTSLADTPASPGSESTTLGAASVSPTRQSTALADTPASPGSESGTLGAASALLGDLGPSPLATIPLTLATAATAVLSVAPQLVLALWP